MANIIVAFSKAEDARSIKNILMKNGFSVLAACTSGAQALAHAEDLASGIIVCGYRLTDMLFTELQEDMPKEFLMLMISSPGRWSGQTSENENLVCLPMPLKVHDLAVTVGMMEETLDRRRRKRREQRQERNEEERSLLAQAKELLMEHSHMTEEEAHRYIQKCSMDSGTNMIETAQMVIRLMKT